MSARTRRRHVAGEVAGIVLTVVSILALWPGLYIYALATLPGA